ncbi:hypothetical protein VNI00_018647 [Paramarasmius palmivorus]|uniref:Uncharacterized protein n=1 Tax=Paramarasmius palmivorus TaxID=297713 RepID=A0AAW0AVD8_9AGAR
MRSSLMSSARDANGQMNKSQYGYAVFHAYLAYKNDTFLQWAEEAWNTANMFVISDQNPDIWSMCSLGSKDSVKFVGGLLTVDAYNSSSIYASQNGYATVIICIEVTANTEPNCLGDFSRGYRALNISVSLKKILFSLSALLAGETFNTTYANTAKSTITFMKANLFSGANPGNPQSIRVMKNCDLHFDEPTADNTAWWIDGISLMMATDNWETPDAMDL